MKHMISAYFHDIEKDVVRDLILNEGIRLDGRKLDEIRPIWSEIDYLPGAHGSCCFYKRGNTIAYVSNSGFTNGCSNHRSSFGTG